MARLYVEALIRADLDDLWHRTQDPSLHQRWDARFGEISYLRASRPQRFRYASFGIAGQGTTIGEVRRPDGQRTSALKFASDHPLSPIRDGAGYWRYLPTPDGVRFVTGYDYRPGWGKLGKATDLLVRPFLGWLTAWSFDRLRIWLEQGRSPERTRNQAIAEVAGRIAPITIAIALGSPGPAVVCGLLALAVPPLPGTPAARRCRRKPPERDRVSATAPAILGELEQP
jgi:hypothetical protein